MQREPLPKPPEQTKILLGLTWTSPPTLVRKLIPSGGITVRQLAIEVCQDYPDVHREPRLIVIHDADWVDQEEHQIYTRTPQGARDNKLPWEHVVQPWRTCSSPRGSSG